MLILFDHNLLWVGSLQNELLSLVSWRWQMVPRCGRKSIVHLNAGSDTDTIQAKDPVAVLTQSVSALCLAVFGIVAFHVGSEPWPRSMMTVDDFEKDMGSIIITAQVMRLMQRCESGLNA
jgi:hypothetical protein